MRRSFEFTATAREELREIDQPTALDILRRLDRFEATGVGDIKKLIGLSSPELRLRVGGFRVRFYASSKTITVLSITDRSRTYR